jgi:hypothetical protein
MGMDPALLATLPELAAAMREARDPWWIIGSAAVALHGAASVAARDVDVLLSVADAERILPALGVPLTPGVADSRFRSDFYCKWTAPPVPVDFMAGFHVFGTLLIPSTREPVRVAGVTLFVPSRGELVAMLRHFGRDKDLARARLLDSTSSPADP